MKNKALIFDIDGTLWDATEQLCDVWNTVIRLLGIERRLTVGEVRSIMGDEQAARTAGIPFIHAAYGFGTAAHPDATIHDFRELTSLIPYCPLLR